MDEFLQIPNLPSGRVTAVIMDTCVCPAAADKISSLGIKILAPERDAGLMQQLSRHADMLAHHLGGKNFALAPSQSSLKSRLDGTGAATAVPEDALKASYPGDISLNFARVGSLVFGRTDVMPQCLAEYFTANNIKAVNIRQGYAKCSTAVVDESSVITADPSVAAAAEKSGIDVLKILPGYIELYGLDSGFLGGCCGKISPDTMAFTGDIDSHPDGGRIRDFLARRGVKALSLTDGVLTDIGGILPIMQDDLPPLA